MIAEFLKLAGAIATEIAADAAIVLLFSIPTWALWHLIAPVYLPEHWAAMPYLHVLGLCLFVMLITKIIKSS